MLYPGNVNNVQQLSVQQLLASLGNSAELQPVDVSAVRAPYQKLKPAAPQPNWNQTPQGVLGNSVQNFARGLAVSATSAPLPDIGSNIDFAYGVTPEQMAGMTQVLQERQKARADAELARRQQMSGQLTNIAQGVDQTRALGLDERKVQLAEAQIPQDQMQAANAEASLIANAQTQDRQLESATIQNAQQVAGQSLIQQQRLSNANMLTPGQEVKLATGLAASLRQSLEATIAARTNYNAEVDAFDEVKTAAYNREMDKAIIASLQAGGISVPVALQTLGYPVPPELVNSLATNPQPSGTPQTQVPPTPGAAPPSASGVQPPNVAPTAPTAAGAQPQAPVPAQAPQTAPAQVPLQGANPENAAQPDMPATMEQFPATSEANLPATPDSIRAKNAGFDIKPSLLSRAAGLFRRAGNVTSQAYKDTGNVESPEIGQVGIDAANIGRGLAIALRPLYTEGGWVRNVKTDVKIYLKPGEIAQLADRGLLEDYIPDTPEALIEYRRKKQLEQEQELITATGLNSLSTPDDALKSIGK
jgi:hypothetical protein